MKAIGKGLTGSALLVAALATSHALGSEVWNTGLWRTTASDTFPAGVNLGFSSGSTAAATPQRWMAQPFTFGEGKRVSRVTNFGFVPGAGAAALDDGFTDLKIRFWTRTGTVAPVAARMVSALARLLMVNPPAGDA